jgi:hypothetical protein
MLAESDKVFLVDFIRNVFLVELFWEEFLFINEGCMIWNKLSLL